MDPTDLPTTFSVYIKKKKKKESATRKQELRKSRLVWNNFLLVLFDII